MTSISRRSPLLAISALGLAVWACPATVRAQTGPTDPYGGMEGRIFDAGGGFKMPYRLGKPPTYDATKKYPLVIFLHGSGESGTDNRLQISKNIGTNTPGSVFTTAANQAKFPTFFIAPQTPTATIGWNSGSTSLVAALKLITALEAEFSIDPNRLYLTGLSLGGMGTFTAIQQNPTLFAAAIPMSGKGDPTMGAKIAKIPLWAFHGTIDPAVNVSGSRDMIAAMRAAGGMPRYTEYPNGMHDIWFMAYNTPELLPWMNAQRLGVLDPQVDGGWPADAGGTTGGAGTGGTDAGAAGTTGAAGGGGGSGAAGTGGGAGTSGAAGAAAGTGGGAAGTGATGASGTGGGPAGAAGNVGSPGAAGTTAGGTGAAGTSGAAGTTGARGSSGGCAVASSGAGSSLLFAFAAVLIAAGLRGRRRWR